MRRRCALATLAAALLVFLTSGCTVGPNYVRPTVDVPPGWRIDVATADELANTRWWRQFDDPALDQLIEQALANNRDLLIAAARVDQFIGQLTTTRAQFFPQLGYGADASRNRASRVGVPALPPGADPYSTLYQGALSAQWQIDLFGRVARQTEAAQAQLYASEQGRRGVVLSLVGSVTSTYVGLRGLDRQLEIARATAANYADTKRIFDLRFKGGVVSAVEVEQINSQYEQALAAIPGLEQQIAAQENLIALLLGRNPGTVARGKTIDQLLPPRLPAALPSSLLERRPDILQAEQNLVAANANVGVAQSLYYPQLSLTGALGSASAALGDFLSSASLTWGIAAALTGPIFTFGAIEGQVAGAEASQREAVANYQRVILNALRETNDALSGSVKKRDESGAQMRRVTALREFARLSKLRWDNGYADYLEVLYAQNELFTAELSAVRSQADALTQIVSVYIAIGGGWIDDAARRAPQPQGPASGAVPR
jgi:multidrug efflux system outer membrane protein